jgi:hypothetical protein
MGGILVGLCLYKIVNNYRKKDWPGGKVYEFEDLGRQVEDDQL